MTGRRLLIPMLLGAGALLAACGSSSSSSSSQAPAAPATSSTATATAPTSATSTNATSTTAGKSAYGPEGIPLEKGPDLAPAATTSQGATVDGVQCDAQEQVLYHIHAHLQ